MRAWVNRFVPFRSSFSNWSLPLTAFATVRAASPVISPKDRLSSCQTGERIIDCGRGSSASQLWGWIGPDNCFPMRRAGASGSSPSGWGGLPTRCRRWRWPRRTATDSRRSWSPGRCAGASGPERDASCLPAVFDDVAPWNKQIWSLWFCTTYSL